MNLNFFASVKKDPPAETPLKQRLRATINLFLEESNFDPFLKPMIEKTAPLFLKNTSDDDIREAITHIRDEVIPFLLGENENSN